jgi:ligand-binding sensor domain-containing protein
MKRRAFLTLPIIGAIAGVAKRCFGGDEAKVSDILVSANAESNDSVAKMALAMTDPSDIRSGSAVAYWDPESNRWAVIMRDGRTLNGFDKDLKLHVFGWLQKDKLTVEVRMVTIDEIRKGKPPNAQRQ